MSLAVASERLHPGSAKERLASLRGMPPSERIKAARALDLPALEDEFLRAGCPVEDISELWLEIHIDRGHEEEEQPQTKTIPSEIEAALSANSKLRRLFRRDKRTKIGKGDPAECDFALACALYKAGIDSPQTIAAGLMASRFRDRDAWAEVAREGEDYFERTARNAINKVDATRSKAHQVQADHHAALTAGDGPADQHYPWNELGNSARFDVIHGDDLLFHQLEKRWAVWNGSYFAPNDMRHGGEVGIESRVKAFLEELWALPRSIEDPEVRSAAERWVKRSGSAAMVGAIISLMKSSAAVTEDELDSDPHLLNVKNGVVDLRTGKLSPHDRKHRCTRITGAPYIESARSDAWESFLKRVLPDPEVRVFFRLAVGYSLLGYQPEQIFFFIFGPGATGKSTAIHAIASAFGSYHRATDFATFLSSRLKSASGPSPDLARLARIRLVTSVEVGHGQALNDGLIKQLSGGDTVTARALHADFVEWKPIMTLWLVANDRPRGRVDDDALWRRLLPIEFAQKIPKSEVDPLLSHRLSSPENQTGVMSWAIRGAREYLEAGSLNPPGAVLAGIESYRESSNPLTHFFEDCCERQPDHRTKRSSLWDAYLKWCKDNSAKSLSKRRFYDTVGSDFSEKNIHNIKVFDGISVAEQPDQGRGEAWHDRN